MFFDASRRLALKKSGATMNSMKLIWDSGREDVLRSMSGEMGSPSMASWSPWFRNSSVTAPAHLQSGQRLEHVQPWRHQLKMAVISRSNHEITKDTVNSSHTCMCCVVQIAVSRHSQRAVRPRNAVMQQSVSLPALESGDVSHGCCLSDCVGLTSQLWARA